MFIVGSGDGYFVGFDSSGNPVMDSDPVCATRMKEERAEGVIVQLEALGFAGRLIPLIFARMW